MKNALKSKINWTAGILALFAMLSDPNLGALIPVEYMPKIAYVGSALTMLFRTFFNIKD
ncbi:MAG: hypothetical protein AAGU11_00940 [Syntrophobacteraceae bacterium]